MAQGRNDAEVYIHGLEVAHTFVGNIECQSTDAGFLREIHRRLVQQTVSQLNRAQESGAPTLTFDEEAMTMTTPNGSEEVVPYTAMEYVIEEEDLILITFGTKVTVIRQTEIVDGDIAEFLPFMEDKTTVLYLHPEAHTVTEEGDGE